MLTSRTPSAGRRAVVVLATLLAASATTLTGCSAGASPTTPSSAMSGSTTPSRTPGSPTPATTATAAAAGGPWLLSLGDSLGFGLQERRFVDALQRGYDADEFGGYVQPLAASLRRRAGGTGLTVVNYACPGETTESMLRGHCPLPSALLHDGFSGPQQQAALTWLAAHRHVPGVIVVSVGANDLLPVVSCRPQPSCGSARLATTRTALLGDLADVIGELRAAAPRARLLYLAPYNPYAAATPASQQVANDIAPALAATARGAGATVVSGYATVNGDRAMRSSGVTAAERSRICALTLFCDRQHRDLHPSDAGYQALAKALVAAVPPTWP